MEKALMNQSIRELDKLQKKQFKYESLKNTDVQYGVFDIDGQFRFNTPPIFTNFDYHMGGIGRYGFGALKHSDGSIMIVGGTSSFDFPYTNATNEVIVYTDEYMESSSTESLPVSLLYADVYTLNGEVVVVGGYDSNGDFNTEIYTRDSALGTWGAVTPVPTGYLALDRAARLVHNGILYSVGGLDTGVASNAVQSTSDGSTWTTLATFPIDIYGANLIHMDGKFYLFGGYDSLDNNNTEIYSTIDFTTWNYEGDNNWFSSRTDFTPIVVDGDTLYFLGGIRDGSYSSSIYKTQDLFSIDYHASLPDGRASKSIVLEVGPNKYLYLGADADGSMLNNIYISSAEENTDLTGLVLLFIYNDSKYENFKLERVRSLIKQIGDADVSVDVFINGEPSGTGLTVEDLYFGDLSSDEYFEITLELHFSRLTTADDIIVQNIKAYYGN